MAKKNKGGEGADASPEAIGGPQTRSVQQVEQIPVSDLIPYARNARTHSEQQVAQIAGSIQEFGFNNPVLIDGQNGIIAGHGRVLAAGRLKLDTVPCIRLTHLSDAQRRAYILADNRIALNSGWDTEMLANELSDLHADDLDLGLLGFEVEELETLLGLESIDEGDREVVEDEVPEPPADPITKPGDLWLLGDHRLLCGDSTKTEDVKRLMAGATADLCFTSPPYASQRKYDESSGFKPIPPDEYVDWWAMIQEQASNALGKDGSFIVNIKEHAEGGERHPYVKRMTLKMIDDWGWKWVDEYAWIRQGIPGSAEMMGRFRNAWESVFWFAVGSPIFNPRSVMHESDAAFKYSDQVAAGKTIGAKNQGKGDASNSPVGHGGGMAYPSNVLDIKHKAETLGHSAAFPVQLPAFFIKANSNESGVVYEPFCGSGSTLIAAEQLGRKCYGMEISPAYCDVIVKRWENLAGKKAVLETA